MSLWQLRRGASLQSDTDAELKGGFKNGFLYYYD